RPQTQRCLGASWRWSAKATPPVRPRPNPLPPASPARNGRRCAFRAARDQSRSSLNSRVKFNPDPACRQAEYTRTLDPARPPRRRNPDPGAHAQRPRQPNLCPDPGRDCPDVASRPAPDAHPAARTLILRAWHVRTLVALSAKTPCVSSRLDATAPILFKENRTKTSLPPELAATPLQPNLYMKRIILLTAVLLEPVVASQAGVNVGVGVGVPMPGVAIAQPPPVVVPPAEALVPPAVPVVADASELVRKSRNNSPQCHQ